MAQTGAFKQVSDVSWEIPTSYKAGMRVPAKIYATRKLLEAMDSGVIDQVTNVACLPGIVGRAFAMADAHWGYGFPIGGVAAFDLEEGVISPGGIGFDVNCLHPDSRVYDEDGVWRRIADVDTASQVFTTFDAQSKSVVATTAVAKQSREESDAIIKVSTEGGRTILATRDHPIMTRRGMTPAGRVSTDDYLLTSGTEGLPHTRPIHLQIVSREVLSEAMARMGLSNSGSSRKQILIHLRRLSLDSLYLDDPRTPKLLKVLGLTFGDGAITQVADGQYTSYHGKKEDLEDVMRDLKALGFSSHLVSRGHRRRNGTLHRPSQPCFAEDTLQASSNSLAVLLVALGAPYGEKTIQSYSLPLWLKVAEPWQKKLFLAAYFGAGLSTPRTMNGYDFETPTFNISKLASLTEGAIGLLEDFRALLKTLGVDTSPPVMIEGHDRAVDGSFTAFRVGILSDAENLATLFGRIGYSYNREKNRLAQTSASFLRRLQRIRGERNRTGAQALSAYSKEIRAGPSLVSRAIWGQRGGASLLRLESMEDFAKRCEAGRSGLVFDRVASVETVPYDGQVYDVTIGDANHNFMAEGVIVSNCGMRLIRTNLHYSEVKPRIKELVDLIFTLVPAGVGVKGSQNFAQAQMGEITSLGVKWCAEHDLAWDDDPAHVEEGGRIKGADITKVSRQAISRGISQFGTLGSGNHYLEVQVVDPGRFFDPDLAREFGIVHEDQVVVMIHCGSRGFGHQICTDYLRDFESSMRRYEIQVRDRDLACLPFASKEAKDYYSAMVCAANFAFVNRQIIVNQVREAFSRVFHKDAEALDMHLVYDVCHNIAKVERHRYEGADKEVLVHRKGATRSFGPGHPDIPAPYRSVGQPVIIGGSMETGSYLLIGTQKAMEETFGSTAHGSGRTMSRTAAKREVRGADLQRRMLDRGIYVKAATMDGLAEEAGMAYKDISEVVETMDRAGISKKVVALRPVGNIKG